MADEPTMLVVGVERRRRGRPRIEESRASVSTWLPAPTHDRLIQLANREEKSISALVRDLLHLHLHLGGSPPQ